MHKREKPMEEIGIVMTCYENTKQVLDNIRHIRNFKELKDSPICVVSTTDKDNIEKEFVNLSYAELVQPLIINIWKTAPGNKDGIKISKIENLNTISWRHKFLPSRILLSMERGINLLRNYKVKYVLHIHSDTFIKNSQWIIEETRWLSRGVLGFGDLCLEDNGDYAPYGVHFHPESLTFNIDECSKLGILEFSNIFYDFTHQFKHYNFFSIESLMGCWINYCISKNCIMGPQDNCSSEFYDKFWVRCKRPYHGDFEHILNLEGVQ